MKTRIYLLSTVSVFALTGAVSAADLTPVYKAAPMPVANWTGLYAGLHGGVARLNYSLIGDNTGAANSDTGGVFGLQIGYNWQSRYWVYGVEADVSWAGLSHTQSFNSGSFTETGKVDWLASFRGRFGLALDDTFVYVTGGLALGGLKSGWTDTGNKSSYLNKTAVGWVGGVGVEHIFAPNWTGKLEFLYYDLGRDSTTVVNGGTYNTEFNHEVFVLRAGLNYRFQSY